MEQHVHLDLLFLLTTFFHSSSIFSSCHPLLLPSSNSHTTPSRPSLPSSTHLSHRHLEKVLAFKKCFPDFCKQHVRADDSPSVYALSDSPAPTSTPTQAHQIFLTSSASQRRRLPFPFVTESRAKQAHPLQSEQQSPRRCLTRTLSV